MNILKCVELRTTHEDGSLMQDKNGNNYSVAKFVRFLGDDFSYSAKQGTKRTLFSFDGVTGLVAGKTKMEGEIIRFDTSAPYQIEDKDGRKTVVSHVKVVVFDGENAVSLANNRLKEHGVTVINPETGEITVRTKSALVTELVEGEGL